MINAYIQGSYVRLDGRLAGIQGESMSRTLQLNFSPEWGELTKRILWLDARGKQVVSQPLVASADEVLENNGLVIPVKIPGETLQYDGKTVFIVEGADENGAISLSAMAEMTVNPNDFYGKNAINATEPTPTEMQHLQATVEEAIGVAAADKQAAQAEANRAAAAASTAIENANMAGTYASQAAAAQRSAEKAALDASGAADRAEAARQLAESYTNNPPVPGDNGNWQVWDGEKYVDSGVQAEGVDGFSPLISAKETSTGVDINITSYDDEKGATVMSLVSLKNGDRGLPGVKGNSSKITATQTDDGVNLEIANTTYSETGASSTATQMVALKNGKDGPAGGVFIATYGETTYADIRAAHDAGKMCFCVKQQSTAAWFVLPLVLINNMNATFYTIRNNTIMTKNVTSNNTWAENQNTMLYSSGGTMTGALTLAADPTEDLHAATKQYVDAHAGGGTPEVFVATYGVTPYEDIMAAHDAGKLCVCDYGGSWHFGTTFTATIRFTAAVAWQAVRVVSVTGFDVWEASTQTLVKKDGDSMTGYLTLHADPTDAMHAATKQYVDNAISAALAAHGIT